MKMRPIHDLLFLVFPEVCAACGNSLWKNEEILCTSCLFRLPKTNFTDDPDNPVAVLFRGRSCLSFAGAYLWFSKGNKVQKLIHQLKYRGRREVGVLLGSLYGHEINKIADREGFTRIIPVPLHKRKLAIRGYNQSEAIAEGLSVSLGIPVDAFTLYRTVSSSTQTRKARFSRWQNVAEIFAVRSPETLSGQHVLLVDDVITTGATLEACIKTLESIPGIRISIAAAAVAKI